MKTVPPSTVALLVSVLDNASSKIPNPRPARFTRVSASGGDPVNLVQIAPRHIVECWAPTTAQAEADAFAAWATVNQLARTSVNGVWISRVELTLPVDYPDPSAKVPRYQFVAQLTISLQEAS